jgi:RecA-family ATPase
VLTGHPKAGKSFLVLAIALAAASGSQVLGVSVDQRQVLYLALEDFHRRIQQRARKLINDDALPEFSCLTRENQDVAMAEADEWMRLNEALRPLVIVDTLEKVRGKRTGNAYQDDYAAGALYKPLSPQVAQR